ncbi:zinc finger protein interacting with ribonucleoprotein K [Drosophila navojoa]|uniref:zinc finger protein interacting with ribonucleoprotein K n=1 Tax=Drosophila navojoa TaxID=7232 RepID=UPI0008471A07|nr:zinc finger protein interacting with ribonucleoprotein K [Drosophila navojoa]
MLKSRDINHKNRFKREDKVQLIAAVKARRLLWDVRHNEHNAVMSIKAAWKSVAADLGRDPQECKVAWRSLRQSYRYHCKTAHTRLQQDDGDMDEADPLETPDIQWEFAEDMSFLQDLLRNRDQSLESAQLDESSSGNNTLEEYTDMEYLDTAYINNCDDDIEVEDVTVTIADGAPKIDHQDVLCRTCAQPINSLTSQNLFNPENHNLLCQIKALTELSLKQKEGLSDFICQRCQHNLNIATEFRRVCIESQTHALIKVQIKKETTKSKVIAYPQFNIVESASDTEIAVEEQRLENVEISEDENYYEEIEVEPLQSIASPPSSSNIKLQENKNPKCQCHQCGLTFATQDLLKMHMHQSHDMQLQTRFVCKHCGHDFKYSAPLVEHLKSIGTSFGYKCEDCGQKFYTRHFLKKHKRRAHGQAVEHICHMCGKNFTTGFNLKNHIIRHSGDRPHKCKLCTAAFSTTAELNNHQRIHDNVRPYPCRYACGKSFRHCSNRSTHERVHMAGSLRPFQCDYCNKTFVTKGDCRSHQMVHTMSRNFSCDICEQSFKLHKHYLQHLNTKSHKKTEEKSLKEKESVA